MWSTLCREVRVLLYLHYMSRKKKWEGLFLHFSTPFFICVVLSGFRQQYLQDLVGWLALDESVMPVMGAFLSGLGFEGSDTFLSILNAEALLAAGATPIIKVSGTLISNKNALDCHLKQTTANV